MVLVPDVVSVNAFRFSLIGQDRVLVLAVGKVNTSGWSDIRLSPRFYVTPPADGFWDFDLYGDAPAGMVLQVILPVHAEGIFAAPSWLKGIRVHAENNQVMTNAAIPVEKTSPAPTKKALAIRVGRSLVRYRIASYDDSIQPIGFCSGFGHIKMKKLVHSLTLVVEGPDEGKIRDCINQSIGIGLIAAIIAVYATGGGALSAAVSAFISSLEGCLGSQFTVKLEDESHWEEWCT